MPKAQLSAVNQQELSWIYTRRSWSSKGCMVEVHAEVNTVDTLIEQLTSRPSVEVLEKTLPELRNAVSMDDSHELKLVSVLLNSCIPETYELLPQYVASQIDELLISRIGLSHLIKKVESDSNGTFVKNLINIISNDGLVPRLLKQVEESKQPSYIFKEVKLLVVYRIFESVNQKYLQGKDERLEEISQSSVYFQNISNSVIKAFELGQNKYLVELIKAVFATGDKYLLTKFFNDVYCNSEMTKLFRNGDVQLGKSLIQYLNGKVSQNDIQAYASILKDLNISYTSLLSYALELSDVQLFKIVVYLSDKRDKVFKNLLISSIKKFGSKQFIDSVPLSVQEQFTKCLIVMVQSYHDDYLTSDPVFLKAISNRLESNMSKNRSLAMSFAEVCFQKTNKEEGKVMFDIKEQIQEKNNLMKQIGEPLLELMNKEDAIELDKSLLGMHAGEIIELPKVLAPERKQITSFIDLDSEDSDDEDDPSLKKNRVYPPVYLPELLQYIQSDTKDDKSCFEKHEMAHKMAAQLIRHKAGTDELKFYSSALLENIIGLSDKFKLPDYESWKLSTLIAIATGDFENSTETLISLFISGDYSLSQRVMILSCLSLTCRELSGYDDDFVKGKDLISNIGPQLLPPGIHEQFISYDAQYGNAKNKQIESVNKITELVDKVTISEGTVIRKSANLTKGDRNKNTSKTRDIKFFNKIGKLYFSLVSVWFTVSQMNNSSGFNIGQFSVILNSHFIKTLSLILECAIPLSHSYRDMINEFFVIAQETLRGFLQVQESLLLEAVLVGLQVITNKTDDTVLGRLFLGDLVSINENLVLICNQISLSDKGVYARCATAASAISTIIEKYV